MDVIRVLLRSSLLTELGDDEDRVGFVRNAAQDLAAEFAMELRLLVPYAVVAAIDESTPATATPLVAAERSLLSRWETFRNAFPELPTEILRAVALAAVAAVAERDDALRQAAWYALRTAVECLSVGRWEAAITDLATEWESAVSRTIDALWSPPPASSRLRMPTIPKVEDERIPVDSALRERAKQLRGLPNPNTFAQQLHAEFDQHVEQVIGVSEVLAAAARKRSVAELKDIVATLGARLRDALAAQDQTIMAVRRRTDLLWWRKTAFSTRLSCPYEDLDPAEVAIAAAVDLREIVPPVAPLAVEHLLADLVRHAAGTVEIEFASLAAAEQASTLPAPAGNTPAMLVDAIRSGTETPVMPSRHALSAGQAAVLIFRDLQARRLAATEPRRSGEGE